jgi:hypothetical protein
VYAMACEAMPPMVVILGMQEQKAAASGADELAAAGSAFGASQIVEGVDAVSGHGAAAGAFAHPVLVHEAAELGDVAGFEHGANLPAEHAGKVQAIEHGGIASLGEALLFAEQGGCAAEFAEKEKHERVAQLAQGFLGHVQRGHPDLAVGLVFLAEKTAIGGDVLVLFADRLA